MSAATRDQPEHPTAFARWMAEMGWSFRETRDRLDMSLSRVQELHRGRHYADGRPVPLDLVTRYAMAALKAGLSPDVSIMRHAQKGEKVDHRAVLALTAARAGLTPYQAD